MPEIPTLRERREDPPLLVTHFLDLFNRRLDRKPAITAIAAEALDRPRSHRWPGNVRELANVIEAAVTFARGPRIDAADLPAFQMAI